LRSNLVIIGGVTAGLAAAMQARRASPDLQITVLERTEDISYGACGLPYVIGGMIPSFGELVLHGREFFQQKHNIDIRLNTEAIDILPAKSLLISVSNNQRLEIPFTNLVIASGASAQCPDLPGRDLDGVFVLRHMRDAKRMQQHMERVRPRTAVVVGAGYIGLEMAEAFAARGLKTTLVQATDKLMTTIGGKPRDVVVDELTRNGVHVVLNEKVVAFDGTDGRVDRVLTDTNRVIDADIVSIGAGVRPNVKLAVAAGLELGESGAILTDQFQRTSVENIFAAGDCCEVLHRVSGRRIWFPLGQPAVRQGWVAGSNAAVPDTMQRYAGVVGTNIVKVFDLEVGRTGLSEDEAREAGFEPISSESDSASRAGYYPGGTNIFTRIVHDRRGRLLGAQMVGQEGVAQRLDVYAAALHAGLKLDDIAQIDLAYSPPFAPTIDPILRAIHRARQS
jgi:NADPH-dependent 2,4-dienoyl-CoA reductase/sulfur reductase-like enzyme